jgi:hypothetical protein
VAFATAFPAAMSIFTLRPPDQLRKAAWMRRVPNLGGKLQPQRVLDAKLRSESAHRLISCVRLTFGRLGPPFRHGNGFAAYAVRRLSSEWPFYRMKLLFHRMGECAPGAVEKRPVVGRTVWPARHPSINQVWVQLVAHSMAADRWVAC